MTLKYVIGHTETVPLSELGTSNKMQCDHMLSFTIFLHSNAVLAIPFRSLQMSTNWLAPYI